MNINFEIIIPYIPYILGGLWVTIKFTILSAFLGILLGILLSIIKISKFKVLKALATFYTSVFRGTPLILQLAIIYFATPQLINYDITGLQAGVIAFSLNSAAYTSETIRAGIMAIDKGQREAAVSLGVPYNRMMLDIILPQAFKNILPALVNEGINLLKDSALVSTIGTADLLRRANIVAAEQYVYFEPLLFVGLVYYLIVILLTYSAKLLEGRLRVSD
ncbi:His/Glu/Gln/Arg/opine family amino acid ABC transporter permease subunit [Lysinibacillus composti]|uniref:Amino acid ABC transporter permease n=1 Tax=Lysinibacillus composti TaxID=720633 RepID=A0A3N9UAI6_9BACI|nr:amino acid ABC transporter permease [Lysinibacillus composti]MBM7609805.1 His/Glu/Gln/Arg/opine family amino acid ABC transporter permease subunit [Lysinibacillus composti]RQW73579.1 amino acid ABC transporter permease [Lysinibacillus composti]